MEHSKTHTVLKKIFPQESDAKFSTYHILSALIRRGLQAGVPHNDVPDDAIQFYLRVFLHVQVCDKYVLITVIYFYILHFSFYMDVCYFIFTQSILVDHPKCIPCCRLRKKKIEVTIPELKKSSTYLVQKFMATGLNINVIIALLPMSCVSGLCFQVKHGTLLI